MLCDKLPRARLAYLPTPLEEAPRLSEALGGPRILIKRDDRSGLSFGGNKPRMFEFIYGDALAQGCDVAITPAGMQSNHLREATAAANILGLKSVIVVLGTAAQDPPRGNTLLLRLLGAEFRYYAAESIEAYYEPGLMAYCNELRAEFEAAGHAPYVVHFSLRAGVLSSVSHVNAAEELAAQFEALGCVPDYLYLPCGSGVTASGFALGLKHLGLPTRVVATTLFFPPARAAAEIARFGNLAAEELGLATRLTPADFDVLDTTAGGYGAITDGVREAIGLVARTEGLFLDPTYNGRAMSGLMGHLRSGLLDRRHSVVLLHTGGSPAIFSAGEALLEG